MEPETVDTTKSPEQIQALYESAGAAIDEERLDEAKHLLLQVVRANPQHEQAWFQLAGVVTDLEQTVECLHKVLALNPNNATAKEWLSFAQNVKSDRESPRAGNEVEEPPGALLGKYLVDRHFITAQQLEAALQAQAALTEKGRSKKIGEILIEQRAITREQIDYVIHEQERDFYSLFRD